MAKRLTPIRRINEDLVLQKLGDRARKLLPYDNPREREGMAWADSYHRMNYSRISYDVYKINKKSGRKTRIFNRASEFCFVHLLDCVSLEGLHDNEFFMIYDTDLSHLKIPGGTEYLRMILSSPLARFLCYNVEEFLEGKEALIIRITPFNTAWYQIVSSLRHVREYDYFAKSTLIFTGMGVPWWLAICMLDSYRARKEGKEIIYTRRASSHYTLHATNPFNASGIPFGMSRYPVKRNMGRAGLFRTETIFSSHTFYNADYKKYLPVKGFVKKIKSWAPSIREATSIEARRLPGERCIPLAVAREHVKEACHGKNHKRKWEEDPRLFCEGWDNI